MRAELFFFGEIIGVKVLEDAHEVGLFVWQVKGEVFAGDSAEGVGDAFIFEDSAAGDEPEAFGRLIFPQAEQYLIAAVFDDYVYGHEGRSFDHIDKVGAIQFSGFFSHSR
jgi:hypothetical protein